MLNPSPRPGDLAFGVLNTPYAVLSGALMANARLAGRWREALQIDPLAPGVLAGLILGLAASATGCRAILYGTYSSTTGRRSGKRGLVAA